MRWLLRLLSRREVLGLLTLGFLMPPKAKLRAIAVSPVSPALSVGDVVAFTAVGYYANGSAINLTSRVAWSSSAPFIISITNTGNATAKAEGSARVSASLAGVTGWTDVSGIRFRNSNADAADVAGALTLTSTFDCLSVSRDYVGSQSVSLEYKPSASGTWLSAYPPIYDDRSTIGGNANPYQYQYRGSIVGLSAGTSYDVRMTIGASLYTGTVSTIASAPTLGGTTYYIDDVGSAGSGTSGSPWNNSQWATAQSTLVAGDTLVVRAGTYSAITWTKSGTENAWIAIVGDDRDTCLINGGTTGDITVSANYVQFKNLRLKKPVATGTNSASNVVISSGAHHVWLDNLHGEDIQLPTGGQSYGNAAVSINGSNHHIYVLNSVFHAPSLAGKPDGDFDIGGFGVQVASMTAEGALIVKGNTFDGKFQDVVGSAEVFGSFLFNHSDIANNTMSEFCDEGIQIEGDNVNLRVWGNSVTGDHGNDCVGMSQGWVGPTYIFRNLFVMTATTGDCIFKFAGNFAFTFGFHNTIDDQVNTADVIAMNLAETGQVWRNNIFRCSNADMVYRGWPGGSGSQANSWDYNLYYRAVNTNIVFNWNNAASYDTVAQFFTGTGNEQHGISGTNPNLQGSTRTILNTSAAYNAGVSLANFNDANSAWPAANGAPDMGYYEVP